MSEGGRKTDGTLRSYFCHQLWWNMMMQPTNNRLLFWLVTNFVSIFWATPSINHCSPPSKSHLSHNRMEITWCLWRHAVRLPERVFFLFIWADESCIFLYDIIILKSNLNIEICSDSLTECHLRVSQLYLEQIWQHVIQWLSCTKKHCSVCFNCAATSVVVIDHVITWVWQGYLMIYCNYCKHLLNI